MRKLTFLISFCVCVIGSAGGAGLAVADEPDPGPTLSISPGQFAFGPINVGAELGEPGEFTLSNPGPGAVQLDDVILEGPDPYSFKVLPNGSSCYFLEPAGSIPAGSSCTVVAIFDPESEGAKQASLKITSDSVTSPDLVPLTGTGLPRLMPGATLTPQVGGFGGQLVGTTAPISFELRSSGTGDLGIHSVKLTGTDRDQFSLVRNGCTQVAMAAGDQCAIEVAFSPTSVGPKSARLTVETDAEAADTTVDLSGTGTEPAPPAAGTSRIKVGRRLPRLRRSTGLIVPVTCMVQRMDYCHGRITVKARGKVLGLRHNRLVRIGSRSYDAASGDSSVRVQLSRLARRALRRRGSLPVRVIATTDQGDGQVVSVSAGRRMRR